MPSWRLDYLSRKKGFTDKQQRLEIVGAPENSTFGLSLLKEFLVKTAIKRKN